MMIESLKNEEDSLNYFHNEFKAEDCSFFLQGHHSTFLSFPSSSPFEQKCTYLSKNAFSKKIGKEDSLFTYSQQETKTKSISGAQCSFLTDQSNRFLTPLQEESNNLADNKDFTKTKDSTIYPNRNELVIQSSNTRNILLPHFYESHLFEHHLSFFDDEPMFWEGSSNLKPLLKNGKQEIDVNQKIKFEHFATHHLHSVSDFLDVYENNRLQNQDVKKVVKENSRKNLCLSFDLDEKNSEAKEGGDEALHMNDSVVNLSDNAKCTSFSDLNEETSQNLHQFYVAESSRNAVSVFAEIEANGERQSRLSEVLLQEMLGRWMKRDASLKRGTSTQPQNITRKGTSEGECTDSRGEQANNETSSECHNEQREEFDSCGMEENQQSGRQLDKRRVNAIRTEIKEAEQYRRIFGRWIRKPWIERDDERKMWDAAERKLGISSKDENDVSAEFEKEETLEELRNKLKEGEGKEMSEEEKKQLLKMIEKKEEIIRESDKMQQTTNLERYLWTMQKENGRQRKKKERERNKDIEKNLKAEEESFETLRSFDWFQDSSSTSASVIIPKPTYLPSHSQHLLAWTPFYLSNTSSSASRLPYCFGIDSSDKSSISELFTTHLSNPSTENTKCLSVSENGVDCLSSPKCESRSVCPSFCESGPLVQSEIGSAIAHADSAQFPFSTVLPKDTRISQVREANLLKLQIHSGNICRKIKQLHDLSEVLLQQMNVVSFMNMEIFNDEDAKKVIQQGEDEIESKNETENICDCASKTDCEGAQEQVIYSPLVMNASGYLNKENVKILRNKHFNKYSANIQLITSRLFMKTPPQHKWFWTFDEFTPNIKKQWKNWYFGSYIPRLSKNMK